MSKSFERPQVGNNQGSREIANISTSMQRLQHQRSQIEEVMSPSTLRGRARAFAVSLVPWRQLRDKLQAAPMEELVADQRDSILDLYGNMRGLLRIGKDRVDFHRDLEQLVENVEKDPSNDENSQTLREKLRARAEASLKLQRDPETEVLLAAILDPEDEVHKSQIRESLVNEAKDLLNLSEPTIKATEAVLIGTARTFDTMMARYAATLELREAMDLLHKASGDIVSAESLGMRSFDAMTGEINLALEAAALATRADQLGDELNRTTNQTKLKELQLKSDRLLQEARRILPAPQQKKDPQENTKSEI
jgi:hypothetical protein